MCMLIFLLIQYASFVDFSFGLTLPQCVGADAAIELNENVTNQVITCTDVLATDDISVYRVRANNSTTTPLICDTKNNCTNSAGTGFTAIRSFNVVNVTIVNPALRRFFGNSLMVFEATTGSNTVERCPLDVVYKPNMASCNAHFITIGSEWLAVGKCVIDKVFSFRDRYSCVWTESNEMLMTAVLSNQTSLNITLISGTSRDDSYYTMECAFSKLLPEMSGNYNYTVIVYPGDVHLKVNFTGSNSIDLPAMPTPGCPNGYIPENTNLNCTCFTTNLGTPPAKVAWSGSNESYLAFNVKRSHNNNTFTCEVRWGSRVVKQNVTTLLVAYGPDSVVINGPPDPFDTNGEQNLTLRCTALDYNPHVSYLFRRVNSPSVICSSNSCTLRPQPLQDNGVVYECLANNSATSLLSAKVNYTLNINYPPTSPPSIVNYSDNDIVYSGDFLNMTCIVKGGMPSNATKINFTCSGKSDGNDIIGNDEVNSTITFTQLNDNDHGRVCNCTAKWKNYTWYTLSAQRILNVYYPPLRPNITERNKPMFPYLEGEYVRLSCDLIFKGNPSANLSWSFYRAANESRTNDTSIQLELQYLGKNDSNKVVTCSAENNFTQTKDSTVMSTFVLHVYYRPILELRQGEDNSCEFTSEVWQCAVTEGRRIDIQCTADSNPVTGNITWHSANWTSAKFTNSSQLYIPSANKSEHNGIFTCRAFTTKPNISDTRLPLNSTKDLYVLVKYVPCNINLILNSTATNMTVMEKEDVTFVCRSNGRPTPTVILFNQDNSTQLFRVQGGALNLADEITTLNYTIPHSSCEDTGNYACSGENDVGKLQSNNASLRVNCKPRYANGFNQNYNTTINYVGFPKQTTIELIAFPVPEKIIVIGPVQNLTSSEGTVSTNIFSMTCSNTYALYAVSCNITLDNITSDSQAGYYTAFIGNSFGNETLVIRVKVNETGGTDAPPLNIAAICGGIGAAVAFIIFIFVAVLIAKKRFKVQKQDKSRMKCIQHKLEGENETGTIIQNDLYGDVTGNLDNKKLLSMKPTNEQAIVYENVVFQGDQSDDSCQTYYNPAEGSRNKDGLVYTTVHFSEIQSKKAEMDLPKQEKTEYATIIVNKISVTI